MIEASNFIQTIETRQGTGGLPGRIISPEFINAEQVRELAAPLAKDTYIGRC